jgi:hypothetical protein
VLGVAHAQRAVRSFTFPAIRSPLPLKSFTVLKLGASCPYQTIGDRETCDSHFDHFVEIRKISSKYHKIEHIESLKTLSISRIILRIYPRAFHRQFSAFHQKGQESAALWPTPNGKILK